VQVLGYLAQANHGVDQNREEDRQAADQNLRKQTGTKPDDQEGGNGDDRDRLAGNQVG